MDVRKPTLWKEAQWKPQAEGVTDAGRTWHSHFHLPAYQKILIMPATTEQQRQGQWGEPLHYRHSPRINSPS